MDENYVPLPSPIGRWKLVDGIYQFAHELVPTKHANPTVSPPLLTKSSASTSLLPLLPLPRGWREAGKGNLRPVGFFNRFNLLFSIVFPLPPPPKGGRLAQTGPITARYIDILRPPSSPRRVQFYLCSGKNGIRSCFRGGVELERERGGERRRIRIGEKDIE